MISYIFAILSLFSIVAAGMRLFRWVMFRLWHLHALLHELQIPLGTYDFVLTLTIEYEAVVETNWKGFVKTISLVETRYSGIGCTGAPFLTINTKYGFEFSAISHV